VASRLVTDHLRLVREPRDYSAAAWS